MQYDPVKKSVGRFFSGSVAGRKIFLLLLDLLLLRAWHVRKALRRVALKNPHKASMLDAGAGFGQYSWRLGRMNGNWKIKAVDIDPDHTEANRAFFEKAGMAGRITCQTADLRELNDSETYDFILSVDVMEHIDDDQKVFNNFFRALKPGGILLISTPSDKGGSDVHGKNDRSFIEEHVRDGYSITGITEKLSKAGFRNIKALYTYGTPGHISWILSMKIPVKIAGTSGFSLILLPFYFMIVFPFAVILNIFDIFLTHSTGTGLLVSAER